jgi:hypothetical protein
MDVDLGGIESEAGAFSENVGDVASAERGSLGGSGGGSKGRGGG